MNMSNKAIFLDRDDTLIEDPGYVNHPDQVRLLDGVPEALKELRTLDYKLIVVSNQSAVARGIVSEKVLSEIHDRLKQVLAEQGAYLDQIYYCPYHPEAAIPKYRKDSDWRKPNPGMMLTAADEMDIDLSQSWCIGDSSQDIEAGLRAGCRTILISSNPHSSEQIPATPKPDFVAVNIREAVNIIKKLRRSADQGQPRSHPVPSSHTNLSPQVVEPTSHAAEHLPDSKATNGQTNPPEPQAADNKTELLLRNILEQLKSMQRTEMFSEFSIMRLIAGVVQIIVLLCLLITIWFLMSPSRQNTTVLVGLGFAAVLQMMALTFYIMQGRK